MGAIGPVALLAGAAAPGLAITAGGTIYAASAGGGVWSTSNDGGSWMTRSSTQPDSATGSVVVDPTNAS